MYQPKFDPQYLPPWGWGEEKGREGEGEKKGRRRGEGGRVTQSRAFTCNHRACKVFKTYRFIKGLKQKTSNIHVLK